MSVIHLTARLLVAVFICASLTNAQAPQQRPAVWKMLIIADNQEHLLTGGPLKSFSPLTERLVTTVGLRSPLANVGGRLLMREALKFGKEQGADFVLHLGDAVDISCEKEMKSVFRALDQESPGNMWFMTPGNHDGILAGNFAEYQDPVDFDRGKPLALYNLPPLKSHMKQKVWFNACQSPTSDGADMRRGADMPRGRAIELYLDKLKKRPEAKQNSGTAQNAIFRQDGREIRVPCRIEEIEITPKKPSAIQGYKAIARICDPQWVPTRKNIKVGQYASFIVQKIDLGETRIVLLDTSDYEDPTDKEPPFIPIAAGNGNLTDKQQLWAEPLFKSGDGKALDRKNVIVAGHHPFSQLSGDDKDWIAARSSRYISAHVHTDTSLIPQKGDLLELNVGSTVDYPPQAVIAVMNPGFMRVRVAGAETNWEGGFTSECITEEGKWKLGAEFYKNYRSGLYMKHLLAALREAADMHDLRIGRASLNLEVPTGTKVADWKRLEVALRDINESTGKSRTFWACQAFYAAKETRNEKGFLSERIAPMIGFGFTRGKIIPNDWASF